MARTAELVKGYRALIAADPDLYDGDIDVVMWLVKDIPDRSWTPSEVGRAIGIETSAARCHLDRLAHAGHITVNERGAWTRYTAR